MKKHSTKDIVHQCMMYGTSMAEENDQESFLSLEDEIPSPSTKKPAKKPKSLTKKQVENPEILEGEILDTTVVEQAGGTYRVEWPLIGMDCPDCASKAMRALEHLDQLSDIEISATSGEIKLNIDLDQGFLSRASTVMKSLGHPPNTPFYMISGAKTKAIARRNRVEAKDVRRLMMRQPGILDVDVTREDEILVQMLPAPSKQLRELRDKALKQIIGSEPKFVETLPTRLRADQWRLFGGAIAVPILALVLLGELLNFDPLILSIIAAYGVLIGGLQMFHEAIASLYSRQMGFQVLTSIAVIGAGILGMWEEALMVVILVAIAAHLESSALENARELMQGGLDRIPRTARRRIDNKPALMTPKEINQFSLELAPVSLTPNESMLFNQHSKVNDEFEIISLDLVNIGDKIEIRSGELIPADGVIIDGYGSLDKAPLTGESVPVEVGVGDELNAGLVLARGPVIVEVEAVGEATRLSGLIDAVHSFKEQKPVIQNQIEKFTAIWVPVVLIGALVIWYFMFPENWKIILLLWVVACPCALLLAAAMPHAAALSRVSRMGAIVRGGDILERLSKVNHVLLDKTGTLTSGKPTIGEITLAKGRQRKNTLAIAGGLEKRSSHPYAVAVLEYLESENIQPSSVAGITDIEAGVKGISSGKEVSFIRADLAKKLNIEVSDKIQQAIAQSSKKGHGASILALENKAIAVFSFVHDDTRGGSKELIEKLRARDITVEIISGDQQSSVSAFAKSVGLPEEYALGGLSPEDKVKWVEDRSKNHVTMMVGDGFNDSAALAVADVGIAVGTGESVNLEAADIMFPGNEPKMLVDMYDLSRKMHSALVGNIIISVSITAILVLAVINQFYDQLWVGVLIHEASVLLVIFNGARLAGRGSMMSMLFITTKNLWQDTIDVFKQLNQHYLKRDKPDNQLSEVVNHATS